MRTLASICLAIAVLAAYGSATAKPTLTFVCDVPVGNRFDQVDGKIKEGTDGYTDVRPIFILDDQKPGKLLLVWGPTKGLRDLGVETKAQEAAIVSFTKDKITAIVVDEPGADIANVFSLYPAKGLVYYTKHYYLPFGTGIAISASFHARCASAGS